MKPSHQQSRMEALWADFNGHNHAELAAKYGLSLQQIYTALRLVSEGTRANGKRTITEAAASRLVQAFAEPSHPFPKIDPGIEELMIRVDLGHFENYLDLAGEYGFNAVQAIKVLTDYRPLQARSLRSTGYANPKSASSTRSASSEQAQGTSAVANPSRKSHRTDQTNDKLSRLGSWKKSWRNRCAVQSPTNKVMAPQTDCTVRISGDTSGLSLSVSPANGRALVLTFASGVRNADTHTSCRE